MSNGTNKIEKQIKVILYKILIIKLNFIFFDCTEIKLLSLIKITDIYSDR